MRKTIQLSILLLLLSSVALAQKGTATLYGEVRDCPQRQSADGIDVYVYLANSPVGKRLDKIEDLKSGGSASGLQGMIDSYTVLFNEVRRNKPLAHAVTDAKGGFRITGLPVGKPVVLLGIMDRKDEPVYYTYKEIEELGPFEQKYGLNMAGEDRCGK
jgi:hypothetical protein